jgi:uncharacterized protein YkwD
MTFATWIKSALLTLLIATTFTSAAAAGGYPVVVVDQVNRLRTRHGADPVAYSAAICTSAQAWADHLGRIGTLAHSVDSVYGENLAYFGGRPKLTNITTVAMLTSAVDMWYSEIDLYDFKHPAFTPSTGHFTQLVWQGSTAMGYGLTQVGTSIYIVMQFYKRGNVNARFEANVFPLRNISTPTPQLLMPVKPMPPSSPSAQPAPSSPASPSPSSQPPASPASPSPSSPAQPAQPSQPSSQPSQPSPPRTAAAAIAQPARATALVTSIKISHDCAIVGVAITSLP